MGVGSVRRATRPTLFVVVALLLPGCGSSGPAVAPCYTGAGTSPDGKALVATLRLSETDGQVTGTYVVGETTVRGLSYTVAGSLAADRFTGTFTLAGQAVNATGSMTPQSVDLDAGQGFAITRFTPGGDGC